MPTYDDNLKTAQGLEKLLDAMKSICGDEWEEIIAEQRPIIEQLMARAGHSNPLKAVMPAVEQMRADGHDPMLIIAVATDMCIRQPKEANPIQPISVSAVPSGTPETDALWDPIRGSAFWENHPARLLSEKLELARNHNRICISRMELERNELREALRKAIVWAESAAAQITDNRADINWSYLEDARKVLSSQNAEVQATTSAPCKPENHKQTAR